MKQFLFIALLLFAGDLFGATSGKRQVVEILTLTNDANGIFEDQTTSNSAALDLDGALVSGGTARPAAAQKVSIEGTGNNSGITFAIVGTGADGKRETETLTGANNGTATTTLFFRTVTSVTSSGAVTGDVEGGFLSAQGAVSPSLVPDLAGYQALMSILLDIDGTMTVTIDHTSDRTPSPLEQVWLDTVNMVGLTADGEGNIVAPVNGVRARITAYTSGTLELLILQAKR